MCYIHFFSRIHAKYGIRKYVKLIHLQYEMHLCTFLPGLDYQSCPTSEDCENNAVDSYWKVRPCRYSRDGWLSAKYVRNLRPGPQASTWFLCIFLSTVMITLTLFSAPESCEGLRRQDTVVAGAERNVGQMLAIRGPRALSAYVLHHGCV